MRQMTIGEIEAVRATLAHPLPQRATLDAVTACDHYSGALWAAAMTMAFGPTDLHASRCDATGAPLRETLETFPSVVWDMERARERVENILASEENAHRAWGAL
jgi:hypothetical protein